MTDPFPAQDPIPAQDPAPAPAPDPAPPADTYVVDRVIVRVVVARMTGGHKTAEFPCEPVPLLWPFALDSVCEGAVEQVGHQQETAANA